MEAADASDKEAPPHNVKKKDLTESQQLEVISILRMKSTAGHFQRGAIMDVTKRFNMTCSTIYRLWQLAMCMCMAGIINTPKLVSWKMPG